jgi:hypothetical protein
VLFFLAVFASVEIRHQHGSLELWRGLLRLLAIPKQEDRSYHKPNQTANG